MSIDNDSDLTLLNGDEVKLSKKKYNNQEKIDKRVLLPGWWNTQSMSHGLDQADLPYQYNQGDNFVDCQH